MEGETGRERKAKGYPETQDLSPFPIFLGPKDLKSVPSGLWTAFQSTPLPRLLPSIELSEEHASHSPPAHPINRFVSGGCHLQSSPHSREWHFYCQGASHPLQWQVCLY